MKKEELEQQEIQNEVLTSDETEKKKNGSKALTTIIILFVLLLIGCGVSYYTLFMGKDTTKKDTKTTKTEKESKDYYSTYRLSSNSLEKFDIEFLKLENTEKNKVYSPLSIKYALQMLNDGTAGDSREQINAIVGDYKPVRYVNDEHMAFANAMFIRNEFSQNISDNYKNNLVEKYNAEIINDSFENAETINNWVSNKTFKMINGLVSDEDVKELNFVLVNALAIDMQWRNLIQCEAIQGNNVPCKKYNVTYSHEKYSDYVSYISSPESVPSITFNGKENIKAYDIGASFNNYDIVKELGRDNIYNTISSEYTEWLASDEAKEAGKVETDVDKYTNKFIEELDSNYKREDVSTDFMIYSDDEVKAFAKDLKEYDGMTLQYVGIMPKKDSLKDYIKKTSYVNLTGIVSRLKTMQRENFKDGVVTKVKGSIPVFDFEYELDLMNDLKKMGVEDVFDINKADFGNMLTNKAKQFIGTASHKATITFSNQGIKAAAATALGGAGSASGPHFEHLYDVPIEEIDMTFDKPYMFIIRDKATGEVWFTGTVYEPLTK